MALGDTLFASAGCKFEVQVFTSVALISLQPGDRPPDSLGAIGGAARAFIA